MEEVVVHVKTLEQWKSVLDIWFEKGYTWQSGDKEYSEDTFEIGGRFLNLDDCITYGVTNHYSAQFLEYSEFMEQQQAKNSGVKTRYVTQEQLDLIDRLSDEEYPLLALAMNTFAYGSDMEDAFNPQVLFTDEFIDNNTVALTQYLAGDESIVFKAKEKLYRLWGTDHDGDKSYFAGGSLYTPATSFKKYAFTAPLDEITKWQTPDWHIEEVEE